MGSSPSAIPPYKKRLAARVWYIFISGIALGGIALSSLWLLAHWSDPDRQYRVFNFIAAWFPFAVSIFLAFIPDLEKKVKRAGLVWRVGVIVFGLGYSAVLWHQQSLAMQAAHKDEEEVVMTAVTKSNEHTDQQIGGVRGDLHNVTEDIGGRLNSLEKDLSASISEVKPPPPKFAELEFTLFELGKFPSTTASMRAGPEGIFTIDFTVRNVSDAAASRGDLWVEICGDCIYAQEPPGFDKPTGLPESSRHKTFGILNPGASLEKMTVEVKLLKSFPSFEMAARYSCETCGKMRDTQKVTIFVLPPLKVKLPAVKIN